jgi:hypothetical protein
VAREVFRTLQEYGGAVEGYEDYLASFPCTCELGRDEALNARRGRVK